MVVLSRVLVKMRSLINSPSSNGQTGIGKNTLQCCVVKVLLAQIVIEMPAYTATATNLGNLCVNRLMQSGQRVSVTGASKFAVTQ